MCLILKKISWERCHVWELIALPPGAKSIRVKWSYKTKCNGNEKVEKHKSKLVAKGYSQ